jgi:hypothetical protein
MVIRFRPTFRHPFFVDVRPTPAPMARSLCTALIGTYAELLDAAESGVRVRRAVYVLHGPETQFISQHQRDTLWLRFQVPMFALLLGRKGKLMAWECELQEGLHIDLRTCELPRAVRRMESTPCDCGRPGIRLIVGQTEAESTFSAAEHASPVAR